MNKFAEQFNKDIMIRYQQKLAALNIETEKNAGIADIAAKISKKKAPLDIFTFSNAKYDKLMHPDATSLTWYPHSFKDAFKTLAAPISGMGGSIVSLLNTPITFTKDLASEVSNRLLGRSNNKVIQKIKAMTDSSVKNIEKFIPDAHNFVDLGMPENIPGSMLYNAGDALTVASLPLLSTLIL